MTREEIQEAFEASEELEYHVEGVEQGASLLPGPGWYSCVIDGFHKNGNAEISLTAPELRWVSVTVLRRNFAIAFRAKQEINQK